MIIDICFRRMLGIGKIREFCGDKVLVCLYMEGDFCIFINGVLLVKVDEYLNVCIIKVMNILK